jgi:hypothetical protein
MTFSTSEVNRLSSIVETMILDFGKRFHRIENNVDLTRSAIATCGKEIALLTVETHKQRRMLAALARNQLTVEEHTGKIILQERAREHGWKYFLAMVGVLASLATIWAIIYECIKN